MTIIRQLPRDVSALVGEADDTGPLLSGCWCCGATDEDENAAGEPVDTQSESKSGGTNSMVGSEGTESAAVAKSGNNARHPPIVFSPVDESKLTMAKERSIADRSFDESTFVSVDDNDSDLFDVIAGIMGIGHKKEDKASASGTDQTFTTESSSPETSATKTVHVSNVHANDDTSFYNSTITKLFPAWVAFSNEADDIKLTMNESIEIKPKKKRNKLTRFLFKHNKKSAFVASPSDNSTAMSSIGQRTAW